MTPKFNLYDSGEAYQSWNSAHASEMAKMTVLLTPVGLRPPVSASATNVSSASRVGAASILSVIASPT